MEWKTFGMRRKLGSARQRMSKVLRIISSLRRENSNISSPTPVPTTVPYETVTPLTDYPLEAEMKKAQALEHWRIWENRPK